LSKGILVLEDGTVFEGNIFGSKEDVTGEVVFNTSLTGYQEILTDPSYFGQIVVMTYPLIGNYGTNSIDEESERVQVSGLVVGNYEDNWSNFQGLESLDTYLKKNKVTASPVSTREL
jgi:carbamoyl-phosphate synthase small subunit